MAYGTSLITGLDLTAYTADKPTFAAENILWGDNGTITSRWTAGGTNGESDITNASYPTINARDGYTHKHTRPDAASRYRYLNFRTTVEDTFNYFFLHLNPASLDVATALTLQICSAGDGDFTPAVDVYPIVGGDFKNPAVYRRFYPEVRISGDAAGVKRLFSGVEYFRLKFDAGVGNTHTPQVNEVMIGTQTQLHKAMWRPFDDNAATSSAGVFISKSGIKTRNVHYKGMKTVDANLIIISAAQRASIIQSYIDMGYGTRPFLWCPFPQTPANTWLVTSDNEDFDFPEVDVNERPFKLLATEQGGSLLRSE